MELDLSLVGGRLEECVCWGGGVEWKALVESKRRNKEKCLEAYNMFNICSTQTLDETNHLKKGMHISIFFAFKIKCLVAVFHSLPLYLSLSGYVS